MHHVCHKLLRLPLLLAASLIVVTPLLHADYVLLKDGFALAGKVEIEGEILRDPGGKEFWIKKLGGFYLVNDGVRRMTFSVRQVAEAHADPKANRDNVGLLEIRHALGLTDTARTLRHIRVEETTAWNSDGVREITLMSDRDNAKPFTQCIVAISPTTVRASTRGVRWNSSYLTKELPAATTVSLLRRQLAKRKPPATPLEEKQYVFRFCLQAGWLDEARAELDALVKEHPEEKERTLQPRADLERQVIIRLADELDVAAKAGQHARVGQLLTDLDLTNAPERIVTAVRKREVEQRHHREKLQNARRHFNLVRQDAGVAALGGCEEVLAEIERDLNHDTHLRLEPFTTLAFQEAISRASGGKSTYTPEQLLALAISGWVLGKNGAEADVSNAVRLCHARRFLQNYLRTPDSRNRDRMREEYTGGDAQRFDVLVQLIELLPPAVPFPEPPKNAVDVATLAESGTRGVPYRIQLPPEYHDQRAYPVLLVLPNAKQDPKEAMEPWSRLAATHGYVLVAPKWADLLQASYNFSAREHDAVLTVIRDVRRRVHVDSERVFLAGFEHGATLAYDLGLAHPDQFAGVVTVCGKPSPAIRNYKYNAQYLPFYVIDGEKAPDNTGDNRRLFEYWVHRGFPSIYVEYSGRGLEFYPGELPNVFDWMGRKKRSTGLPDLGGLDSDGGSLGNDFRALRPNDNRFYWITSDDVSPSSGNAATLTARIGRKNDVLVRMNGFKQISVWLNHAMLDLQQPVDVRVVHASGSDKRFNKVVEPSLGVLLEDYFQRGDKTNLFVARVDFKW